MHKDIIRQIDGLDQSLTESINDESGSNSLSRLPALTVSLKSHI